MDPTSTTDDSISCSLCLEVFNDPRGLPCGHTFCLTCLQKHIDVDNKDDRFLCPNCRDVVVVPDGSQNTSSWASQFKRNLALMDAITLIQKIKISDKETERKERDTTDANRVIIESACETIKKLSELFEKQTKSDIERLQQQVNARVAQLVNEVDKQGDELITDFAAEVFKQQKMRNAELERYRQSVNKEIEEMFADVNKLIGESKECLKLGDSLLRESSPSDLKRSVWKFKQLLAIATDYADTPRPEVADAAIALSEPVMVQLSELDIGRVVKSEALFAKQINGMKLKLPFQTDTWINRQSYALKLDQTLTAVTADDKQSPCLTSIAVIGQDHTRKIIAVDCDNKCIKLFYPKTKRCQSVYRSSAKPQGLAKLPNQMLVLVTLPQEQMLLYLDIQDDIKLVKTVKTDKEYYNIAALPGNKMAVTVGWYGCVDIVDQTLRVLHSVSRTQIPIPDFLTVKGDSFVVVSQKEQTLTCVTSSGRIDWLSRDPIKLQYIRGVSADAEEFVYACDYKRNAVVQLSRDGHVLRDVIKQKDGLTQPWVVCCDREKVYVAQINGDIKIFTWSFD